MVPLDSVVDLDMVFDHKPREDERAYWQTRSIAFLFIFINAQSASLRSFLCFVRVLKVYVNCRLE